MSIQTNGYNAEYGRAAGGVINVNLKSGTNQLHGSLFEYLQNKDLNANTLDQQPRGPTARTIHAESVRRDRRRPDHQEQALHLRRLPGNAHRRFRRFGTQPRLLRIHHGSYRGDEDGRFFQPPGRQLTPGRMSTAHPIISRQGRDLRSAVDHLPDERRRLPDSVSRTPFPGTSFPATAWIRHSPRSCSSIRIRTSRSSPATRRPTIIYYNTAGRLVTDQGDAPRRLPPQRQGQPVRIVELVEHLQDPTALPSRRSRRYRLQRHR